MQITTPSQRAAGEWFLKETIGEQIGKLGDISGWAQPANYGASLPIPALQGVAPALEMQPAFMQRDALSQQVGDIRSQISGLLGQAPVSPVMPDIPEFNVQQAGYARLGALLAQFLGARSQVANQAVEQFDAGQADIQNRRYAQMAQKAQGAADAENLQNKAWLDQLGFDLKTATGELDAFDAQQAANEEIRQFNEKQALEREKIKGLNDRAKGTWENRLANTRLTNEGRIALEQLKIDNPVKIAEIKDMAEYIETHLGKEEADKYIQSMADEQALKNAKEVSVANLNNAKKDDILAFRQPKLKELAAKLGLINAQTGAYNALAGKREQETMEIIAMADAANLLPEEIALIEESFNPQMEAMQKSITQIKWKLEEAQSILGQLSKKDKGYDAAANEVTVWKRRLAMMEDSLKEDEVAKAAAIKLAKDNAKSGKTLAPSSGAYSRINYSAKSRGDSGRLNKNLLSDLQSAGDSLGMNITVGTAISGHSAMTKSGNRSRHTVGNAVDITHINGHSVSSPTGRKLADKLVAQLVASGAVRNSESGNQRAVLWQMNDHYDHIHYSNKG